MGRSPAGSGCRSRWFISCITGGSSKGTPRSHRGHAGPGQARPAPRKLSATGSSGFVTSYQPRVNNDATVTTHNGLVLGQFTLDPTRDYQRKND